MQVAFYGSGVGATKKKLAERPELPERTEPSLRWLAYIAPRLEGLAAGLLVVLPPGDPASMGAPLLAGLRRRCG